jgi:hypothetical protein
MEVIKINNGFRGSYSLFITPGEKVEIHTHRENGELVAVRIFRPGDVAEYDSFNLAYTAPIKSITAKNIIFDMGDRCYKGKTKRLNFDSFAWRNHDFDAVETANQNAIISMSI